MRLRFNAAEKALIASLAASGHEFSWKDASNWTKRAVLTTGELLRDGKFWYVEAVNLTSTRTISSGAEIRIYPGGLREIPLPGVDTATLLRVL